MTEIIFLIFKMIVNFKIIKVQNQEHTECTSCRCNYKLPIEPTIAGCRGTLKFKSLTMLQINPLKLHQFTFWMWQNYQVLCWSILWWIKIWMLLDLLLLDWRKSWSLNGSILESWGWRGSILESWSWKGPILESRKLKKFRSIIW